jgi:Flp pilus assembly protein TadG
VETSAGLKVRARAGIVSWDTALGLLAVLILVGGFVAFFRAKRNAEKAAAHRSALALAAECQAREDERRAARDAAKPFFNPADIERAFTDEVKPLFPKRSHHKKRKAKSRK